MNDDPSSTNAQPHETALSRWWHRITHRFAGAPLVVLDGVMHTRNSFLEFVRAFDECAARADRRAGLAHA